jgi:hypothetical protein
MLRPKQLLLVAVLTSVVSLGGLASDSAGLLGASAAGAKPGFRMTLSSGLFSLPANAVSVDWAVVNKSTSAETIRVTVLRHGIGVPPTATAPGPITATLNPGETFHNANSVGVVFQPGFYYEMVIELNDESVLPIIHIWQDFSNTVIPGTLIPSGDFVPIS